FDQIPDFPPRLRTLVEHMIISHHGELEFGSPRVPAFPEALLLHHLDNLDSKMEAMRVAVSRDRVDSEFTGWITALERVVLKKDRFLGDSDGATKTEASSHESMLKTIAVVDTAPEKKESNSAPPAPGQPLPHSGAEQRSGRDEHNPPATTVFGEKLQAVLQPRK